MENTENKTDYKYEMSFERAASAGKIMGFKVKARGDDRTTVLLDIQALKSQAEQIAPNPITEVK